MDIKETGELCYTYTNYKNGSNAFYDDFRHMTSILRKRKQRCRRKYLRTMNYSYIDQLNAGIHRKKRRRTKMKEKKLVSFHVIQNTLKVKTINLQYTNQQQKHVIPIY